MGTRGNFSTLTGDHPHMDCTTCRENLSARLDGETEPDSAALVDEHLGRCAQCRTWLESATELSRPFRLELAARIPDQTEVILAQLPNPAPRHWKLRLALRVAAVAQLIVGVGQVLGIGSAHDHAGTAIMSSHLFNESTAWNLGIGLALLWASLRWKNVAGLLPVLTGFVVLLAGFSVYDLAAGAVPFTRLLTHIPLVAGLALLYVLHVRQRRANPPTPGQSESTDDQRHTLGDDDSRRDDEPPPGRWPLRPVGRQIAA